MANRNLKVRNLITLIIVISLFLCSCGHNDDLPDGAEYFVPIWFENLSEYCTGNYNRMSEFKNGYAVVSFAQMGRDWSVSDEQSAIIDKSGEIILGLLDGDLYINIIDDKIFYIQNNDNLTSKIVDVNNNIIGSFDGILSGGKSNDGELFNKDGISCLCYNNIISKTPYQNMMTYGLVKKSGQVIVPCEYARMISNVTDEYIVFLNDDESETADVYNPNGSFSHSIYLDYKINSYKNGLLEIYSNNGYGVADIYGDIIVEPNNDEVEIVSEKRIIVSKEGSKECKLLDREGKPIKNLELNLYNISEMNDDVFMISDYRNTYLMTYEGEIIKEYSESRSPMYCGDGMFSIESGSYSNSYIQLVDGTTGELIGEKYNDRNDIKFNEGYAVVEDLEGNAFVIDKNGNKYCEGYDISGDVSDGVVKIFNDTIAGIICLPPKK